MARTSVGLLREQFRHAGEELVRHHLRDPAEHALTHAGDEAAHLHVRGVGDRGAPVGAVTERHDRLAAKEPRPAAALDRHPVALRRLQVEEADLALERALDGAHADLERGLVLVLADLLELLAAGERLAQPFGVEEGLPHRLARCRHRVRALELHAVAPARLPARMLPGEALLDERRRHTAHGGARSTHLIASTGSVRVVYI